MDLLKVAREKAIDGGSATEKSEIFQEYKNQINDYLNANGHDVAKAYKDWDAKQAMAQNQATNVDQQRRAIIHGGALELRFEFVFAGFNGENRAAIFHSQQLHTCALLRRFSLLSHAIG